MGHPLLLVCTHGKHDRCCARYGRPLYQALAEQADDGWVWQSSHVGGDRFAGNVVVLPDGLYFGRVEPADAWSLLDEYLAGRIDLEHYRGRSAHTFAEQAAERAIRADDRAARDRATSSWSTTTARMSRFRAGSRMFDVGVSLRARRADVPDVRRPRRSGVPGTTPQKSFANQPPDEHEPALLVEVAREARPR